MKGKLKLGLIVLGGAIFACQVTYAAVIIDVHKLNDDAKTHGIGEKIGTITFEDGPAGLQVEPKLTGLSQGDHGFHIHENGACNGLLKAEKWLPGEAAGGHLDPQHTKHHLGPHGKGHLGDLPVLVADTKGDANTKVVASRLKMKDILGHSIVIHQGGDNYSDNPPMGGGGARIACGVISKT